MEVKFIKSSKKDFHGMAGGFLKSLLEKKLLKSLRALSFKIINRTISEEKILQKNIYA